MHIICRVSYQQDVHEKGVVGDAPSSSRLVVGGGEAASVGGISGFAIVGGMREGVRSWVMGVAG